MSYQQHSKQKFDDLDHVLKNINEFELKSNGGKSILFTYPPDEENLYIQRAKELYEDRVTFIDLSKLFVGYIEQDGIDEFINIYKGLNPSSRLFVYEKDNNEDLFDLIIKSINESYQQNKIPFLIRTGILNGTGIENMKILEHKSLKISLPLVVFYPAKIDGDKIKFLNFKNANNYRCTVIK